MDQRYRLGLIIGLATISFFTLPMVTFGQPLPDGKGKAEFQQICSSCHTTAMVTRLKNTPDEWKSIVDDMVSRGAQGSQADLDNVVLYLSTNFGSDSKSPSSPAPTATLPTSIQTAPATATAKRIIAQNGCEACHRIGNEGSYIGPDLNDVGTRRKPSEIRSAIVHPPSTVQPENRQVRLVQRDGKTVVGKILNQDEYSVHMVDATGHLATYSKSGLREFTIVDANPMPSFENKITGQELDDLVHYLSSLARSGK
jgi:putative heme-binding domain-containing protein